MTHKHDDCGCKEKRETSEDCPCKRKSLAAPATPYRPAYVPRQITIPSEEDK